MLKPAANLFVSTTRSDRSRMESCSLWRENRPKQTLYLGVSTGQSSTQGATGPAAGRRERPETVTTATYVTLIHAGALRAARGVDLKPQELA